MRLEEQNREERHTKTIKKCTSTVDIKSLSSNAGSL